MQQIESLSIPRRGACTATGYSSLSNGNKGACWHMNPTSWAKQQAIKSRGYLRLTYLSTLPATAHLQTATDIQLLVGLQPPE